MKKSILLIAVICFTAIANQTFSQTRYVDEMFSGVTVTDSVVYATNIGVITGAPAAEVLTLDVYEPTGDLATDRPLLIYIHTGSFLPRGLNQATTGDLSDSALVEMCSQFAMRGYVVAAIEYRKGWNPLDTTLVGRVSGLLNAAYRGIQDANTTVRFFKDNFTNGGNTYGIDTSKIVMVGQGTGGYISFGCATLDKYSEINLLKFLNSGGTSVVDTSLSGDFEGKWNRPINLSNHAGFSSNFHMAVNLGGALGDSSWLEAGDVPMVSLHCPNDPFAPYGYGMVVVPTTGENVVFVSGSHDVVRRANYLGNNSVLNIATFNDVYTMAADGDGSGVDNLFPLVRTFPESAPWEWWNVADPMNSNSILTNMDMAAAKGQAYIDTIMGYINPRISCVLDLNPCGTVGTGDTIADGINENAIKGILSVYPNPSSSSVTINSSELINAVTMYDVTGKVLINLTEVNAKKQMIDKGDLPSGLYFIRISTESSYSVETVMFE